MSFEERLLMELKNEIAARRRKKIVRRALAGAAAAGVAAAVVIGGPQVLGGVAPAYAVTQAADGIYIQVHELRDADNLETDLAALGVRADVSYLGKGKRCAPDRGVNAGLARSAEAVTPTQKGIRIVPAKVGKGQTVVLEFAEDTGPETARPQVAWTFVGRLMDGTIKPCQEVDDPSWNDIGGPEGQPPAHLRGDEKQPPAED
ncbi:hypothetical protein [Nonomuraea typhae]|uniref:Uncharacterized protein n=1 Tax=Nonomuraea typhae TaxID=2603600 RepID=A0ABW7YZ18_9ACTN